MYERRHARPLPRRMFVRRVANHFVLVVALGAASLALGMFGYWYFEGLSWLDAFLNASMLLGGMGPVESPHTPGGKLFAGLYALFSGIVFLISAGIIAAPLLHRVMHKFHWEQDDDA